MANRQTPKSLLQKFTEHVSMPKPTKNAEMHRIFRIWKRKPILDMNTYEHHFFCGASIGLPSPATFLFIAPAFSQPRQVNRAKWIQISGIFLNRLEHPTILELSFQQQRVQEELLICQRVFNLHIQSSFDINHLSHGHTCSIYMHLCQTMIQQGDVLIRDRQKLQ